MAEFRITPAHRTPYFIPAFPQKPSKQVQFNDNNVVKMFDPESPPSDVSGSTEELFRNQISRLEEKIKRLELEKSQSNIPRTESRNNLQTASEGSINSRPVLAVVPQRMAPLPPRQPRFIPEGPTPAPQREPTPSRLKKVLLGLGAVFTIATIPGFILGLSFLGPVGLVIPAATVLLSAACFSLGNKVK